MDILAVLTLILGNFLCRLACYFVKPLVLKMRGVQNIADSGTKKLVSAALGSFVVTTLHGIGMVIASGFAFGFANLFELLGYPDVPFFLVAFLLLFWSVVGIYEYNEPDRTR